MTTTERKPHVHADVIKAWADGATIQYLNHRVEWENVVRNAPFWEENTEYRVKPEPKPEPKTWYQVVVKAARNGRLYIFDGLFSSADHFLEERTESAYTILKLIPVFTEE